MRPKTKKPKFCDVCRKRKATIRNTDGGLVCDECYEEGYSDEMPNFGDDAEIDEPEEFTKNLPIQVNRHETLVNRLRMPIDPSRSIIHMDNDISNLGLRALADKMDAIGEALAYLIDKKHAKQKVLKLKKQIKRSKSRI